MPVDDAPLLLSPRASVIGAGAASCLPDCQVVWFTYPMTRYERQAPEPKLCKCGCGEYTRGGIFRPGHDARYHAAEKRLIQAADHMVRTFREIGESRGYDGIQWLNRAGQRFCDVRDFTYPLQVARAILEHPTMQDTPRNRANGYTPYTTPEALLSQILRASS